MATNLGLVANAAKRHADIVAPGCPRDGFGERGLADTWRADQAENRSLDLVRPGLHRKIFENTFLDLIEREMLLIQDFFRVADILADFRALGPRNRDNPVDIVPHDRSLGRHRAHVA